VALIIYLLALYWPREYRPHLLVALALVAFSIGIANWLRERKAAKSR